MNIGFRYFWKKHSRRLRLISTGITDTNTETGFGITKRQYAVTPALEKYSGGANTIFSHLHYSMQYHIRATL